MLNLNFKKMKKILIATVILIGFSLISIAQNENVKVIALVNSAKWCGVCKANGPRVTKDVLPSYMMNKDWLIVMNDLSDNDTKASSKENLEKAGIYEFAKENNATGMIYFIDPVTKKLIDKISLTKSDDDIKKAFDNAALKG